MPIPLRLDFDAPRVRALARRSKDAAQTRRLLALAAIYEGASRTEAAVIGGVTLQIVRDWVLKFNAHGPGGLIDRKAPGPTPRLQAEHRAALAAIIETGPTPAAHGVLTKSDALSPAAETLAERLQAAGYRTLALVTNGNVSGKLGFRQGFAHMRQLLRGPEHSAIGVNAELERWLDATAADPRPFFAYLHVVEPHGPYTPPEPYRGRFADGVPFALGSRDSLRRLQTSATPPPAASVDGLRALYDAEVAEVDAAFGALRAALEQRGLWGSTAVVVLADHGEEFLDHGRWGHWESNLYDEILKVPLIMWIPNGPHGQVIRQQVLDGKLGDWSWLE